VDNFPAVAVAAVVAVVDDDFLLFLI